MAKTFTLIWHFYRPLLLFNLLFSGISIFDLYKLGVWFIGNAFFIKLVGYAATIGYKQYFSSKTNLYFLNTGHSMRQIYGYAFGLDCGVWLIMVIGFYIIT